MRPEAEGNKALQGAKREAERFCHYARMAIMIHRVSNDYACLDNLLMLWKTFPDKIAKTIVYVYELSARQK